MLERAFRLSWFLRTVAGGRLNVATAEPLYSPPAYNSRLAIGCSALGEEKWE